MFQGFKEFIMRGNLIELAVAVILATSFAAVVKEFTNILLSFISLFGGMPDFSSIVVGPFTVGLFFNALLTFVFTAGVIYFFVITPYNKLKERQARGEEPAPQPSTDQLLMEIRDLLKSR